MSGGENINKKSNSNFAGVHIDSTEENKVNITELTGKFLRGFFESRTEDQIKDLFNLTSNSQDSTVPDNIRTSLLRYKSLPKNDKDFQEIDTSLINRFDIIKELMSRGGLKLESSRKHLANLLEGTYKINDKQKNTLNKTIENFTQSEINKLVENEKKRDNLVVKLFRKNKPIRNKAFNVLKKIEGLNYESLNDKTKQSLEDFTLNGFETPELIDFLKKNFSLEQKKVLLKFYLGPISLGKLEEYGIIDKNTVKSIIDSKAKEILKSHLTEAEINARLEEIKELFNPYDVIISPDEIFSISGKDEEKVANILLEEDAFTNFFREARKQAEETEQKDLEMTKDEFRLKLGQLRTGIKNLDKIQKGDVIKCIKKDETEDGSNHSYIYIKIEDITESGVIIKDLTHTSGGDKICKNINDLPSSTYNFSDILFFLEQINGGNVMSEKEFKAKIENKTILALPSEELEIKDDKELKELINNFDSKGANFGLEVGTTFNFKPSEEGDDKKTKQGLVSVASITKIDKNKITIRSLGETTFTLTQFYQSFRKQDGARVAKINDVTSLLQSLQGNESTKGFGELEWDKDKKNLIYSLQKDNAKFPKIDHFVNKKGECLKIIKNNSGFFDVQIGELKEKIIDKNKKGKEFEAKSKSKMSPEIFFAYLTKHGLNPYIDKELITAQENINKVQMEQKTSYSQAFFKLHNFASIFAGGKQFIDHIKHTLKATNDLQAAEFALSLGKILPAGMQSEFRAKVDGTNKKKMGEKISELENLGPGVVMDYITSRLKIKNLPKYELEALLIFVMKKHGSLYPTKLKKYAGSYFWFKKLAGMNQNDDITKTKIYQDYANPRYKDGLPIVEEDLIEKLIVDLSLKGELRSSFTSEFLGAYRGGMKDGKEGGLNECKDQFTTIDGKINFAKGRILDSRYMNALGAVEGILEKGGSAQQMNHIPFIFMASGILRTLHVKQAGEYLKGLGNKHREPMLLFAASSSKMDVFDKIFMDFAKDGGDMEKEANAIMEARKKGDHHESIIKLCDSFWQKYGASMVTKFNTTDPEMMLMAKEKGGEYSEYMGLVNGFFKDSQCSKDHKDNGLCDKDRINFMACGSSFLSNNLSLSGANKSFRSETQEKIFSSIIEGLDDIKNSNYDEEKRKKIFRFYNIEILKWLIKNNQGILPYEKLEKLVWGSKITNRLWIPGEADSYSLIHNLEGLESGEYNQIIDIAFKNFIKSNIEDANDGIEIKKKNVKLTVDEILKIKDSPEHNLDITVQRNKLKVNLTEAKEMLKNSEELTIEQEEFLKKYTNNAEKSLKKNNSQAITSANRELEYYLETIKNENYDDENY